VCCRHAAAATQSVREQLDATLDAARHSVLDRDECSLSLVREYGSALCAGSIDTRLSAAVMAQRRVELKLMHAPLPTASATQLVYEDVADDNDDDDNNDDEQMRDEDVCCASGTRVAADAPTRSPTSIARYSARYVRELMADIEMLSIRGSTCC